MTKLRIAAPVLLLLLVPACGSDEGRTPEAHAASDHALAIGASDASVSTEAPALAASGNVAASTNESAAPTDGNALPTALVYKTPTCGCCNLWVDHLREAGFEVDARNLNDLIPVKIDAGVPPRMSSCHTALIDGYVVEGHIPAEHVKRLLDERPDIVGIAVPGMPIGSPGMEGIGARPYQVLSWDREGNVEVYAEVDPSR